MILWVYQMDNIQHINILNQQDIVIIYNTYIKHNIYNIRCY